MEDRYQEILERIRQIYYDCNDFPPFENVEECNCTQKKVCLKRVEDLKILEKACEKAKKYDEKETPKKTIKEPIIRDRYRQYKHYCPICKQEILILWDYCLHCGQKVDWS